MKISELLNEINVLPFIRKKMAARDLNTYGDVDFGKVVGTINKNQDNRKIHSPEEIEEILNAIKNSANPWQYYLDVGQLVNYDNRLAQILKTTKNQLAIKFDDNHEKIIVGKKDKKLSPVIVD